MAYFEERKSRGGGKVWRVQVRVKGHPDLNGTFARKTDARRWAEKTETEIRTGRYLGLTAARRHTLAELVARYRASILPRYGARHRLRRDAKLRWWEQRLGDYFLADITPQRIGECREELIREGGPSGRRASPATAVRYLAQLSHVFSHGCRELGWVGENPVRRVSRPREPRGRVRFLSSEEKSRLLEACRWSSEPRLYPLVLLAMSTGARQSELLELRWSDVDVERGVAVIQHTKNGDRRALPLAGAALQVMQELAARSHARGGLVFALDSDHAAFPRAAWEGAISSAKVSDFRFHDLRHTAASYLAMSGATLAEIAEVLGHRTLAMVKRYAHLTEQHVSGVVGRMNQAFIGTLHP
jgi:integrase